MPKLPGSGNLWAQMRAFDAAGQAPARLAVEHRQRRRGARRRGEDRVGDLHVPVQGAPPDRPELLGRGRDGGRVPRSTRTRRTSTRPAGVGRRPCSGCTANQVRVSYYEGSSCYGAAPYDDRRRGGGAHVAARSASRSASSTCAGTSTAGTTTARRSCTTSGAASTPTATSSRSTTPRSASRLRGSTPAELKHRAHAESTGLAARAR